MSQCICWSSRVQRSQSKHTGLQGRFMVSLHLSSPQWVLRRCLHHSYSSQLICYRDIKKRGSKERVELVKVWLVVIYCDWHQFCWSLSQDAVFKTLQSIPMLVQIIASELFILDGKKQVVYCSLLQRIQTCSWTQIFVYHCLASKVSSCRAIQHAVRQTHENLV